MAPVVADTSRQARDEVGRRAFWALAGGGRGRVMPPPGRGGGLRHAHLVPMPEARRVQPKDEQPGEQGRGRGDAAERHAI